MIDENNPDEFDSDSTSITETKLSDELNRLLHSLGSPNIDTVSGVFGLWQELVGEQVATHVTPIKLDRGRLLIEVDDPAWSTHMKFLERDICTSLSHHTGTTISGIDIR
ncbi:MAG: DciA family protein, partial [Acidimicrobiaceae bacterium]